MAKTPRARKVSDATAPGRTKPAKRKGAEPEAAAAPAPARKQAAKTKAAAAEAPASKKAAKKKTAAAEAPAPKKAAKKKTAAAEAPAPKKAAKQKTAAAEAPASKKAAKKKTAAAEAPASKKAAKKKAASADAPAPKKTAKKTATASEAPAGKKASKKAAKPQPAEPVSEQLALSMDLDLPTTDSAPTPRGPLQPGDRVPDFSLQADDGSTYSRERLAGERFVLYFYPKDDTPGCTREACDFRDNRPRFEAASVKVLGVSGDSLKSHARFRSKYALDFPLLADPDRAVAKAFGVVGVKKLYGKQSVGIIRSTFLVGPDGVVQATFSPVKVDGHAEAVLQAIGSG